jgi:mono/diheme cytochrome c family protein
VLCHGKAARGDGPNSSFLPVRPANLQKSLLSDAQKEAIIRLGGAAVGRSQYMPPWGQELSDDEIRNLILYLRAIEH